MPMSPAEVMLVARKVKPTPQRVVITQFLIDSHSHPTAEQIMEAVKEILPVAVSRATVYNTLNALVEADVIREVYPEPGGPARYDANMDEHHHFVDVRTGNVYDIPHDQVPVLTQQLGTNFKVHNYTVTFYGETTEPDK